MKKQIALLLIALSLSAGANEYYYKHGQKVELTKLAEKRLDTTKMIKYYITKRGNKLGVTNEVIVQCKADVNCTSVLNAYSLETVSKLSKISLVKEVSKLSETLFLVKIKKDENIFKVSQELYNNKDIVLAHPNFIKTIKKR